MDDIDRQIRAMVAEGFSDRAIAREVGLSRTAIRKRRAKLPAAEADDGNPDPWTDTEAYVEDDDYEPVEVVPPVTYCGVVSQLLPQGRGEEPKRVRVERWIDARGEVVNELNFYRYKQSLRERGDREAEKAFDADMDRQRRASTSASSAEVCS